MIVKMAPLCKLFLAMLAFPTFGLKLNEVNMPPDDSRKFEPKWSEVILESKAILRNHTVDWGKKTLVSYCPDKMYVWGYVLVRDLSYDLHNVGFNRIDLLCFGQATTAFHYSEAVRITTNFNITFQDKNARASYSEDVRLCEYHNGPLRQFFMWYQDSKKKDYEEKGIVDFYGICWDSTPLPNFKLFDERFKYLELIFNATGTCGKGMAMCGYQLKYQIYKLSYGAGRRSVVDVDPYCCKVRNALDECVLHQRYKVIANVDNRGSPKETRESVVITHTVAINQKIIQIDDHKWDASSSTTVSEENIITSFHELGKKEIKRKFDREKSLFGMIQGIGDMVDGIGEFISNGLGVLLGGTGLGSLFGVGGLPKLIGDLGMDNLVAVDETGLNFYLDQTNFGKLLATDLKPIFHNLENLVEGPGFANAFSIYGYGTTVYEIGKLPGTWSTEDHGEALSKILGNSIVTTFQDMKLQDIVGVYGLAKMYGKAKVYKMIQSGELAKLYKIGSLGSKSWGDGIGRIVDSVNIGKIYAVYVLADLFSNIGVGRELALEELLGVNGIVSNTDKAMAALFGDTEEVPTSKWLCAVQIYLFSQILGAKSLDLEELFEKSGLSDELGNDGLQEIIDCEELKVWFEHLDEKIKDKTEELIKLMAVIALNPLGSTFSSVVAAESFKKVIGSLRYQEIFGSKENLSISQMDKVSKLYAINTLFGSLKGVKKPDNIKEEELEKILNSRNFGRTMGLFIVGQVLDLKSLEKVTGGRPMGLSTLQETGKGMKGRFIGDFLGGLGKAIIEGLSSTIGGIFSTLWGTSKDANKVKEEKSFSHMKSLEQKKSKKIEQSITDRQQLGKTITQTLLRAESRTKKEIIDLVYDPHVLTVTLAPYIACDNYYSVDVDDTKNYVTIIIPESGYCEPEISYNVLHSFDYLEQEVKEKRSYFIEVGTSWEGMYQYEKYPDIKDIVNLRNPTRGVQDRFKKYKDDLTGKQNLDIKNIITRDLNVKQVWKSPETYEAESVIYPFNYNILMQLQLKCHQVVTLSSIPLLVRIPKVFGCTPKGVWDPLEHDRTKKGTSVGYIGLKNGGKDVDALNDIQRGIPEVSSQLIRLAKELQKMFLNSPNVTTPSDVSWTKDTTLIRNPAWEISIPTKDLIEVGEKPAVVSQLIAKCGPIAIALHKYKIKYLDDKSVRYHPNNLLLASANEASDEDCPPHFPC